MRDRLGAGAATVCDVPARLAHRAFVSSKKACDKWGDYEMHVAPYDPDGPIYYEFTACPTAEFAGQFGLLEVMPALCAPTTPPWSCSARGSCAARRAQTAAAATIRSAATGTRGVRSTPNTATRRCIGAIRPDGGSMVGLACPASAWVLFPRGKSTQKRVKTKVLESCSVDKWGFSRTWPKCSIGFRSAQRRYYI